MNVKEKTPKVETPNIKTELDNIMNKEILSFHYSKKNGVLITEINNERAVINVTKDCKPQALIALRQYLNMPVDISIVPMSEFNTLLTTKFQTKTAESLKDNISTQNQMSLNELKDTIQANTELLDSPDDSPVINIVNSILIDAIKKNASDIHFEPYEEKMVIRIRIDGILHNILEVPKHMAPLLVSRIKILANLYISENRIPQDGRIYITTAGQPINIRVSTIPVAYGERVVLRILGKQSSQLNLSDLGFNDQSLTIVRKLMSRPHGIILVTGPTGSGKTTTLYTIMTELNIPGRNIVTVEDPIEYNLPGISQTQVNAKISLSFSTYLRAILRQDPNIIMIGEIRDLETATIAVQASLTGHLILSTLHTNTAIGAIHRLLDLGIQPFLLSSALLGIIAQRLVRVLCIECKIPYISTVEENRMLGLESDMQVTLYKPGKCEACQQTGYNGRIAVFETIPIDQTLNDLIYQNASTQELEKHARQLSSSIWENGCQHVLCGKTSLEEIMRVLH